MKVAIYPGSFDPITYGHLEILKRALNIFDKLIFKGIDKGEPGSFHNVTAHAHRRPAVLCC